MSRANTTAQALLYQFMHHLCLSVYIIQFYTAEGIIREKERKKKKSRNQKSFFNKHFYNNTSILIKSNNIPDLQNMRDSNTFPLLLNDIHHLSFGVRETLSTISVLPEAFIFEICNVFHGINKPIYQQPSELRHSGQRKGEEICECLQRNAMVLQMWQQAV